MKRVAIMFAVGMAFGAGVGCSSGFSCTSKGSCSNDVAPTSAETTACQNAEAGACGSQYKDLGSCVESNSKCGADGKTDASSAFSITIGDAGLVYTGACATQGNALVTCCQTNSGAAGCTAS